MQDVLIFGEGHNGSLRQAEEGADYVMALSKPQPSELGPSDVVTYQAEGFFKFAIRTIYRESGAYLVGVRDDPPTDEEIDRAIRAYRPRPIR